MTAFNLVGKSNDTLAAFRQLNAAVIRFNETGKSKDLVIKAYEKEERICGVAYQIYDKEYDNIKPSGQWTAADNTYNRSHSKPENNVKYYSHTLGSTSVPDTISGSVMMGVEKKRMKMVDTKLLPNLEFLDKQQPDHPHFCP